MCKYYNKYTHYLNRYADTMTFDLTLRDVSANCINAPGMIRSHSYCQKLRNALELYPQYLPYFKNFIVSESCNFSKFLTNDLMENHTLVIYIYISHDNI